MPISFQSLHNILPILVTSKLPVLIRGRHGIGKSQIVFQLGEELGLPVIDRRASQMTEGDLLGLPKQSSGDVTEWCPPKWFKRACTEPVILFLDEVDRATLEVRQGIFELCDSRKLAGHVLHPETLVFACVNGGGDHGDQYQVGEMDPAELDRWTVFDVKPTVEDWLNWADDNVISLIWDFINDNHTHLEHNDDYEPNKKYPSRRSWARLSDALEKSGYADTESLKALRGTGALHQIASGFIGFEGATAMCDYLDNYKKIVTVEDILAGKVDLVKDFKINDHNALIERFKQANLFGDELSQEHLENISKYFLTLPSEIAMHFFHNVISKGDDQAAVARNIASIYKIKVNNTSMKDYVISILMAKK
tara:strand:+ start:270 stop:1364 length:1095 start_codon:yes stop_codon:yes gene_type:complete